jgi:ParB family chromosome partitioning protein
MTTDENIGKITNEEEKMTTNEDVNEDMEISEPGKKTEKKGKDTVMKLFDATEVVEQKKVVRELKDIELDSIKVSKFNVRVTDVNKEVEILAQDLRRHGLRQPIEVRRVEGKELFDVVAGQRRLAAARMLGWKTIQAFVLSDSLRENDRLLSLSENINRVDIDPKDRAMAVLELLEENNNDWVLLSEILNRSVATLQYWVSYCKIPEKIQIMVSGSGKDGKKLGDGYARKLTRYSEVEPEEMVKIAEKIATIPYQDKPSKDAVIAAIRENPKITAKEIGEKLEEIEEDLAISIIFKARVAKIIKKEGERRFEEPSQFIKSIIREYLETRGLLKQSGGEDKKKDKKKAKLEEIKINEVEVEDNDKQDETSVQSDEEERQEE